MVSSADRCLTGARDHQSIPDPRPDTWPSEY